MRIQEHWKLRDFVIGESNDLEMAAPQYDDYFWMVAEVPGDVHSTLKEHGLIEDPFFGHNDQKCRWVEEKVWWYRTVFQYSEDLIPGEKMELIFEGLDTFATVYLNGVELGSTENMFIAHSFEVTRELQAGTNNLAVKFDPVHYRVGSQLCRAIGQVTARSVCGHGRIRVILAGIGDCVWLLPVFGKRYAWRNGDMRSWTMSMHEQ